MGMSEKPRIAIATGDPGGIGPEISIKAALDPAVCAACSSCTERVLAHVLVHGGAGPRAPRVATTQPRERVEGGRHDSGRLLAWRSADVPDRRQVSRRPTRKDAPQ